MHFGAVRSDAMRSWKADNKKAPQTQGLRGFWGFELDCIKPISGGEGGIRTRGGYNPSHAFQACDLNRSSTSPELVF